MTVQDFIVIYNETFKYIEEKYGKNDVKDLWATISRQYCIPLRELIAEKGLEGMYEYWGSALSEEKADFEVSLNDGVFAMDMHNCPSIAELKKRNREIYRGKLSYCQHCPALYPPVAKDFGFDMQYSIQYDSSGICAGKCKMQARKI